MLVAHEGLKRAEDNHLLDGGVAHLPSLHTVYGVLGVNEGQLSMLTLIVTIIYTLILGIILVICNVDPASGYIYGAGYSWDELEIVKNPFLLNLLLVTTICLGWISFLVDIILAWCKNHNWRSHNWGPLNKAVEWFVDPQGTQDMESGFWDEAVLLQGLGVRKE